MSEEPNEMPKRHRYQFSLRTMFVVVTLMAILIALRPFEQEQPIQGPVYVIAIDKPRFKVAGAVLLAAVVGWRYWRERIRSSA